MSENKIQDLLEGNTTDPTCLALLRYAIEEGISLKKKTLENYLIIDSNGDVIAEVIAVKK